MKDKRTLKELQFENERLRTENSSKDAVVQAVTDWYEKRFLADGSILANPKRDDAADVTLCERIEAYRIRVSGRQE